MGDKVGTDHVIRKYANGIELENCMINLGSKRPGGIFTGHKFGMYDVVVGYTDDLQNQWGILRFNHGCTTDNDFVNTIYSGSNNMSMGVIDVMETRSNVWPPTPFSWNSSIFVTRWTQMTAYGVIHLVKNGETDDWEIVSSPFQDIAIAITQAPNDEIIAVERDGSGAHYIRKYSVESQDGNHFIGTIFTDSDGTILGQAQHMVVMPE